MDKSGQWNALTAEEKIEALHDDIITLTTCMTELASIVCGSASAEGAAKAREIEKRLWALGPIQIQRKMTVITGFPPKPRMRDQ
jgi:hypothetical protein